MRVMFAVFPAPAHFWPIVPYAWALQSAGHDVCVAAPPGIATGVAIPDFHQEVNRAGLSAVKCGDPAPLSLMDFEHSEYSSLAPTLEEADRLIDVLGIQPSDYNAWDVFYHFTLTTIRNYHPPKPRADIMDLISFAERWQPDLVLWDPWFPCGGVAAQVTGAAHARIVMTSDYTAWLQDRIRARAAATGSRTIENPLAETVRPLAERYGLDITDELLLGQWTIDPFPAAMGLPTTTPTVRTQYVPYSRAGVMPDWLHERTTRPRIGLSLGVSTREYRRGDWGRAGKLLHAVDGLDVDVIATLDRNQLEDVGQNVPGNVRVVDYVPLRQLLPTLSAIIHHGGPATTAGASVMGVPQLVCDTDERSRNVGIRTEDGLRIELLCERQTSASDAARYVTDRGAGVRLNHQTQSVAELREEIAKVVEEPRFAKGAKVVQDEWTSPPSPTDIVDLLVERTEQHRP